MLQCAFRFPGVPFCYVTLSFHPLSFPSWVLLSSWMYRRSHRKWGQREKTKTKLQPCAKLVFHLHTLDPAVSSPSPSCCFLFSSSTPSYFSLPSPSLTTATSCPTVPLHTHVLCLAMTMYSSASVQTHLKYNAHITWDLHREGYEHACM